MKFFFVFYRVVTVPEISLTAMNSELDFCMSKDDRVQTDC